MRCRPRTKRRRISAARDNLRGKVLWRLQSLRRRRRPVPRPIGPRRPWRKTCESARRGPNAAPLAPRVSRAWRCARRKRSAASLAWAAGQRYTRVQHENAALPVAPGGPRHRCARLATPSRRRRFADGVLAVRRPFRAAISAASPFGLVGCPAALSGRHQRRLALRARRLGRGPFHNPFLVQVDDAVGGTGRMGRQPTQRWVLRVARNPALLVARRFRGFGGLAHVATFPADPPAAPRT